MATQNDFGKSSAHGQFLLDVDLFGLNGSHDSEQLGRDIADTLAAALATVVKTASEGSISCQGEVLCGWRIWRSDTEAPLPCYSVRLPVMPAGKLTVQYDDGQVLPPVRFD